MSTVGAGRRYRGAWEAWMKATLGRQLKDISSAYDDIMTLRLLPLSREEVKDE